MAYWDDIKIVLILLVITFIVGIVGFYLFTGRGWYSSACTATLAMAGKYFPKPDGRGVFFEAIFGVYLNLIFFVFASLIITRIFGRMEEERKEEKKNLNEDERVSSIVVVSRDETLQ